MTLLNSDINFPQKRHGSVLSSVSHSTAFYSMKTFQKKNFQRFFASESWPAQKARKALNKGRSRFSNSWFCKTKSLIFGGTGLTQKTLVEEDYLIEKIGFCSFDWNPESAKTVKKNFLTYLQFHKCFFFNIYWFFFYQALSQQLHTFGEKWHKISIFFCSFGLLTLDRRQKVLVFMINHDTQIHNSLTLPALVLPRGP